MKTAKKEALCIAERFLFCLMRYCTSLAKKWHFAAIFSFSAVLQSIKKCDKIY